MSRNPWTIALAVAAGVLLVAGAITTGIGLAEVGKYEGTVLGQIAGFDAAVATAIVGGVSIMLGIAVGTCVLVLAAFAWERRQD